MAARGQRLLSRRTHRILPGAGPGLLDWPDPRAKRAPVLDVIEGLPKEGRTNIGLGEDATLLRYRPAGWEEQSYVVIRCRRDRARPCCCLYTP